MRSEEEIRAMINITEEKMLYTSGLRYKKQSVAVGALKWVLEEDE